MREREGEGERERERERDRLFTAWCYIQTVIRDSFILVTALIMQPQRPQLWGTALPATQPG